jgi:hypothetical protein
MTKTIEDINLDTWFSERELQISPMHFTKTQTPMTSESKIWILEKLHGRFSGYFSTEIAFGSKCPTFEDPKEAVFYELTWG